MVLNPCPVNNFGRYILLIPFYSLLVLSCGRNAEKPLPVLQETDKDWRYYHGTPDNNQYSKLAQINRKNVGKLKMAWRYWIRREEEIKLVKCNPLIIDGILYATTSSRNVVALNAGTGEEIWYLNLNELFPDDAPIAARGMHYWENGEDRRLYYVYASHLVCIDANTGTLISSFGDQGSLPFNAGLNSTFESVKLSTPGVIYQDKIILGSSVSEFLPAAPGHIRAFNIHTGEIDWIFHTIPQPGEFGYDTWPKDAYTYLGGVNSWSGMSLDEARGIVYVPTASATYDFYGMNRIGMNLFGNCLLALDARTGKRIWHYQLTHHDLWDRDLPCPPNLITVNHDGRKIDAVAQATKEGYVYLFDRETGEPLFEIREIPVPPSKLENEEAWPTQPAPVKPPPFARQVFADSLITDISEESRSYIKKIYRKYERRLYAPPSKKGNIIMPFFNGGANWGGAAFDQGNYTLYINANDIPWLLELIDLEDTISTGGSVGEAEYIRYCSPCHNVAMDGSHFVPSLQKIEEKYNSDEIKEFITKGKGLMPPQFYISDEKKEAIVNYVLKKESSEESEISEENVSQEESNPYYLRYTNQGYNRFLDQEGWPAVKPPWGTLTAIDMNEGSIVWQRELGEYEELTKRGIPPTGAKNQGGPIVTAGGLIFIASTEDEMFRAFDKSNGDLLWEYKLPGPGFATPSTYEFNGEQYVVISVTGKESYGFPGNKYGFSGAFIAFKLE